MAIATYALSLSIAQGERISSGSSADRDKLLEKPGITDKKPKLAGNVPRAQVAEVNTGIPDLSLVEIGEGYGELIVKADAILDNLIKRVGVLDYIFEPTQHPMLAEAVAETFAGAPLNKISYKMYLDVLRLDKDLAIAIGEQTHESLR